MVRFDRWCVAVLLTLGVLVNAHAQPAPRPPGGSPPIGGQGPGSLPGLPGTITKKAEPKAKPELKKTAPPKGQALATDKSATKKMSKKASDTLKPTEGEAKASKKATKKGEPKGKSGEQASDQSANEEVMASDDASSSKSGDASNNSSTNTSSASSATKIDWKTDLLEVLESAKAGKRKIFLYVFDANTNSKKMDRDVFTNKEIIKLVNQSYIAVRVDYGELPPDIQELGIEAGPTVAILTPQSRAKLARLPGLQTIDNLKRTLLKHK